ncbi:MAG TPA: GYD domain-containing protein [Acidobacteriaceae bacterium]|jgi:uncharacterized protein with GYD domain|nr:GYD domain-containing protein [Acidobacteriaceae bacterium]
MPSYLLQLSYTSAALAALMEHPQDRIDAVRKPIEKLGGKIDRFYLSFGKYDVVGIVEMPNNVSAAAFSMALGAGGACADVHTTPLMTTEEGMEVMQKAAGCGYKPATKK